MFVFPLQGDSISLERSIPVSKKRIPSRTFIPMNTRFVLSLLLVTAVVFLLLTVQKAYEPFQVQTPYGDMGDEMRAMYNVSRDKYIETGQKRYNRFSDPLDLLSPGITRGLKTADERDQLNQKLRQAIVSKDLVPADPYDAISKTGLVVTSTNVQERVPPESFLTKAARKCEAQLGRDKCSLLGTKEFGLCGVCIKGGTDMDETKPEKHIGGLLVLPSDREEEEQRVRGTGQPVVYRATVGSCPAGYLFVSKEECEKAVNRQNCKEIGQTGGFDGGKTIEGKSMGSDGISCANCPMSGPTTFIYENAPARRGEPVKTTSNGTQRLYPVRLRGIAPRGTGRNVIQIFTRTPNGALTLMDTQQRMGGQEFVLDINQTVHEGQELEIVISQEFPHRSSGKPEVFLVDRTGQELQNDAEMAKQKGSTFSSVYGFTKNTAKQFCASIGTELATYDDVRKVYDNGAQVCRAGHIERDTPLPVWPAQAFLKDGSCGKQTLNEWPDIPNGLAGAWCKGIKPPTGIYKTKLGTEISVFPFFETYGKKPSVPSQEELPTQVSQHGIDYVAPSYRGICLQWESRVGESSMRRLPIEPSIVAVMGQTPSTITTDGQRIFRILRRYGTFQASKIISSPKPADAPGILANQYWIWNNSPGPKNENTELRLTVKVPGIFANPHYVEDIPTCARGPIVKNKETLGLLKESPCSKAGQEPGSFGIDCLTSLFVGAGGDPYNGKLSPIVSSANMDKLRFRDDAKQDPRTQDEISQYLLEVYSIAATGRDSEGSIVSKDDPKKRRLMINTAGQDMFGMDIVSPCEEVSEDSQGNIVLVPKQAPVDADCLEYLYTNAGREDLLGGSAPRNSTLGATYTNIRDRFSGLRTSEKDKDRAKFPFMTCQRSGTMAPLDASGRANTLVNNKLNALAMASDGNLQVIQRYYNDIYQRANTSLDGAGDASREDVLAQQEAIKQCYGIEKSVAVQSRTGCGVMARFVRVLRSQSGVWSKNNLDVSIQIAQLEVFDGMGNELAKGKQTTAYKNLGWKDMLSLPSAAVDGRAFARPASEGIYIDEYSNDDASQFWMVDLGGVYEIRKVVYYNRSDTCCNHRSLDMPIQLLDADKKLVAHQLLSETSVSKFKETLEFSKADVTIPIPIANIVPGIQVRFRTAVMHNGYLVPKQNMASCIKIKADEQFRLGDATFAVRVGLNQQMGAVSFESVKQPGMFLTAVQGSQAVQIAPPSVPAFASFVVRPALNGSLTMASLECYGKPGFFVKTNNREANVVSLQDMTGQSNPHYTLSGCFQIERA